MPLVFKAKDKEPPPRFAWIDNRPSEVELRETYAIARKNQPKFERAVAGAFKHLADDLGTESDVARILNQTLTPSAAKDQIMANMDESMRRFGQRMANAYTDTVLESATKEVRRLNLQNSVLVNNQRYIRGEPLEVFLEQNATRWAQTLSQEKGEQILNIIRTGVNDSLNSREIARNLLGTDLELLPAHERSIQRSAEALRNRLGRRDGRRKLSPAQIEKRVQSHIRRETKRLKKYRSFSIARTETIRADAQGTLFGWREAQAQGKLRADARMVWIAGMSERTCPICSSLDGTTVAISGGDFESSYERTVAGVTQIVNVVAPLPPAHTMCRCSIGVA